MLVDKQELYKLIINSINLIAEKEGVSKELIANKLGISSSSWYVLKKHSVGETTKSLFSEKRLNEVCKSLGFNIKKELYEVEITENNSIKFEATKSKKSTKPQ